MSSDHFLADLNEPQREAVLYGDGPLLIVAGAGSGKTRVITRRIASLIDRGVQPWEILAITFTNKAAGEMKERVSALVGEGQVMLATFHGFCARVLRVDGEAVGLSRDYSIYDTNDQVAMVRDICQEKGIDSQSFRPRSLLWAISRLKNDAIEPEEAEAGAMSSFDRVVSRVYARYAEAMASANAADFDDLLLKVVELFEKQPDVLDKYRRRYRHVLVDEYQDTNLIQYRIARSIAEGHGNMCATGDPDQSIYRWRGARVQNILDFEQDFSGAHIVRLEQNYRSTNHILGAATGVIQHNSGRLLGELWSELGDGEKLTVLSCDDEEGEADAVVRLIEEARAEGLSLGEIAIFYRTNALSRGLERALRLHNVSYEIVGAVEFYERKEVKDLLAYLKVLANPKDAVSFLRVVNTPSRGIGKTSLERLRAWALPQGLGPREAARRAAEVPTLSKRPKNALLAFSALLDELERSLEGLPGDTLRAVIEATNFEAYLRDFGGAEGADRLENVGELEAALLAYQQAASEPTIAGFLEETALVSDVDQYDASAERVTMMTLHAAKGLEFPMVCMVGVEEGLLPHQRSMESEEDVQEERRLCYVGITRAQRRLVLSHAGRRALHGQWAPSMPSRFLEELPEVHLQRDDRRSGSRRESSSGWSGGWSGRESGAAVGDEEGAAYSPSADDFLDVDIPRVRQRVRHTHFGQGVVIAVSGVGSKARITVKFDRFGEKQLMAEYARLEPA
ncbi:MAG: UvrD-helicase domain-containing protein [Planctomycetota bacterium]|nr:UvrD-helicase domain-containing protein [Planctomycetota bacterium]